MFKNKQFGFLSFIAIPTFFFGNEPAQKESSDYHFYSEVDYILWYANQDGLSYTTVADSTLPISNATSIQERDQFLKPGWNSGVRGVWGVELPHWDTNLIYTYYYARANGTSTAESNSIPSSASDTNAGTIIFNGPSYALFQDFPGVMTAKVTGNWTLHFNRLDWELGKRLTLGNNFILRPFCGIEGLYTNQKLQGTTNTVFQSLDSGDLVTDRIEMHNQGRFMAIGARIGMSHIWNLRWGFNLFSSLSGSLLWGHFNIHQTYNQEDIYPDNNVSLAYETIRHNLNTSIFNCDIVLGLGWKHTFQQGKYVLGTSLGWEEHFYTNMNRFQDFYSYEINSSDAIYSVDRNIQKGDLTLSGFAFGLSLLY